MAGRSSGSLMISLRIPGNSNSLMSLNSSDVSPVLIQNSQLIDGDEIPVYSQLFGSSNSDHGMSMGETDLNFGLSSGSETAAVLEMDLTSDISIWCQACKVFLDGPCVRHGSSMPDQPVLSRAFATLPTGLSVNGIPETSENGIFAKTTIPHLTVFGPLHAPTVLWTEDYPFDFALTGTDGFLQPFCLDSDDLCNWMKFVRLAENNVQQNLMAYQQEDKIYFTTLKTIHEGDELKVWYSRKYGAAIDKPLLNRAVTPAPMEPSDDVLRDFPELAGDLACDSAVNEASELVTPKRGRPKKQIGEKPGPVAKKKRLRIRPKRVSANTPALTTARYRCNCPEDGCAMQFRSAELLNIHALQHGTAQNMQTITLTCPGCTLELTALEELVAHVDQRHSKQLGARGLTDYPCSICRKFYSSTDNLEQHVRRMHTEPVKERNVECDTCHEMFTTSSSMVAHRRTHYQRTYFSCPVCHKSFQHASHMKEHSEGHSVDGVFPCPVCEKSFARFARLRIHLRKTHSSERFPCDTCSMVFNRKCRLAAHMVVHSDKFNHICDQCGKQFKRKDKLREHILAIHQSVRIARRHKKTPEQVKMENVKRRAREKNFHDYVYKCVPCEVGFLRRGMLLNHMINLHPGTPLDSLPELTLPIATFSQSFPCQHCGKVYASAAKRKSHAKKIHMGTTLPSMAASEDRESLQFAWVNDLSSDGGLAMTAEGKLECNLCHRLYCTQTKLLQHQRMKHSETILI